MTTRQHLIEQDCMDRLGWSIDKVATSTDTDMIQALSRFEQNKRKEHQENIPNNEVHEKKVTTEHRSPCETHIIAKLRDSIQLKSSCLSSTDILDEDKVLLHASISKDKQTLENELNVIRDRLDSKRIIESQKQRVRTILQKTVQSLGTPEDESHLQLVESCLRDIRDEIVNLKKILGST